MLPFLPCHSKQQLIEIYALTGQRSAALAQYEAYAIALENELGLTPQAEIQQLIRRVKSDPSSFTKQPIKYVRGSLPAMPALVVGRESALAELKRRLKVDDSDSGSAQVIVQGWPGTGKTTLSALLAHDADVQNHFNDGILRISLGQNPNLLAVLTNWGRSLGFYEIEHAQSIEEASTRLTAFLKDQRLLVILDDVWSVDHAVPLRVGGAKSSLLLTTRLNVVARALSDRPDAIYKIPILSQEESLTLLRTLAPQVITDYPQEAAELASDLEGLPLALQVAGRLLHGEMVFGTDASILLTRPMDVLGVMQWVDSITGAVLHSLTGHVPYVQAYALSPDGTLLAVSIGGKIGSSGHAEHKGIRLWAVNG